MEPAEKGSLRQKSAVMKLTFFKVSVTGLDSILRFYLIAGCILLSSNIIEKLYGRRRKRAVYLREFSKSFLYRAEKTEVL